jgi:hypothetical protein
MSDPGYLGAALLCTGGGILLYLWSLRRSARRVEAELAEPAEPDELTRRGAGGMLAPLAGDVKEET